MKPLKLILSCEHASNDVPLRWSHLFEDDTDLITHRGWDPGAEIIASSLKEQLDVPCYYHPYTRLLVEPNRSLDHPQLFSEYTSGLNRVQKEELIRRYYLPYREQVTAHIGQLIDEGGSVVHVSVHSFIPVWNGVPREVEIGLLFDEARKSEVRFCESWKNHLQAHVVQKIVRYNEPYQGADDGFTTWLRTRFADENYCGIEVEVNQKFVSSALNTIATLLGDTLRAALQEYENS